MNDLEEKRINKRLNTTTLNGVSLKDCAEGIVKLTKNAEELVGFADLFIRKYKKERAIIFLVAAFEECSKIKFLLSEGVIMATEEFTTSKTKGLSTKYFFKNFRSHKSKLEMPFNIQGEQLIMEGKFDEASTLISKGKSFIELGRQRGLYVDFESGKFTSPKESFISNKFLQDNFKNFKNYVVNLVKQNRDTFGKSVGTCLKKLKSMKTTLIYLEKNRFKNQLLRKIVKK